MMAKKEIKKEKAIAAKAEPEFTKAQLTAAKRYESVRDILQALLSEEKTYTHEECAREISDFMKKEPEERTVL